MGEAPEGVPARSTVRASELRSCNEGACNADSEARPTQKEKAPECMSESVTQEH